MMNEQQELVARKRIALSTTHLHTSHVLDDPCRLGKNHGGSCWYGLPPELDELILELKRKRTLERLESALRRDSLR